MSKQFLFSISKLKLSCSSFSFSSKYGTVIHCSLSLNKQSRIHTCDELASLIDVLYCQIEQLIIKIQPTAYYIFDNETIIIILFNENNNQHYNVDHSCRLAIELFRFIQYVNNITQYHLILNIGIDYNQINIYSLKYIQGLAYDYSRWLCHECPRNNCIHVSLKIYELLKENQFYKFSLITSNSTYLLSSTNMYQSFNNNMISMNISDMIDQLTRIQVNYYIKKHLGTITLICSLRKQSLFELTKKNIYWYSLNFKEANLTKDFQLINRTNLPNHFNYVFVLFILIGTLLQLLLINNFNLYYLIIFPWIIVGILLLIIIFHYFIFKKLLDRNKKTFIFYFNIFICLTLTTFIFMAIQYYSIDNFKHLLISKIFINKTIMTNLTNLSTNQIIQ